MSIQAQGEVVEIIHGVEVRDPYRWLENRQLPETEAWIREQNRLCDEYFSHNRSFRKLKEIVSDTLSVEAIDQVVRAGDRVFLRKQLRGEEQPAIWVRQGSEAEERLLVDPAFLGPNVSVGILRVSLDGSLLACSVRSCGSDEMEVRIADVVAGVILPDCLPLSYLRGFEFDASQRGFYYSTEPAGGTADLSIRHHQFGDSAANDAELFSTPRGDRRLTLLSGGEILAAVVTEFVGIETVQDLYIAEDRRSTDWRPVIQRMTGHKWLMFAHGGFFCFDMESTPNGSLVELGQTSEVARIVVPEQRESIQKCLAIHGGFLVTYLIGRQPRIEQWSIEGTFIRALTLPSGGSIELLAPSTAEATSVFFLHESYTEAPSLWECRLASEHEPDLIRWTVAHEQSPAVVRESWYYSGDGTQIPLILLEPHKKHSGPQPVVLFGYGGFGATEVPRYSRLIKILVELGVTIARPGIRGGAEFGEQWHQAATGRKRQTAIDDFLAAAQWLISEGITDAEHLAIMGSSNGGLLVAAAAVQRAQLFRAVVCTGPLTDMVRYERFNHASRWRREYGTVEDGEDFRALLAYSPYHGVSDGVDYPATLLVTGNADDRCNPAHARKMAAAFKEHRGQLQPILLDHGERWGHAPTLSLTERIEALTRKTAFLCDQLNISMGEGVSHELPDS